MVHSIMGFNNAVISKVTWPELVFLKEMKCPHKSQFRRVTIYISGAKLANDLVYGSDLFQG